jgi:biopolymer transport protein ExbB/biopolymer transport protein TolQ
MLDQLLIQGLMQAGRALVFLTMAALTLFSVYSLALIAERWWTFRRSRQASRRLLPGVLQALDDGKLAEAQALCERAGSGHVGRVLSAGLAELAAGVSVNSGWDADRLPAAMTLAREAMQRATGREIERLERGLTGLATLGNISPFVGLFGTVIGVMRAFEAISRTGTGGLATVSAGIAEALVATAAGLFVAIPAVVAYNHFVSGVKSCAGEMDAAASELLARLQRRAWRDAGRVPAAGARQGS